VGSAGHTRVNLRGLGDHPLDGKSRRHPLESRLRHSLTALLVVDQLDDGRGESVMIAGFHENACDPVINDLRDAAGFTRHDRL
jgi:hypothetical protein